MSQMNVPQFFKFQAALNGLQFEFVTDLQGVHKNCSTFDSMLKNNDMLNGRLVK